MGRGPAGAGRNGAGTTQGTDVRLPDGRLYLDCNATTPLAPGAEEQMARAQVSCFGNPSSPYQEGRAAREALAGARDRVAALVGCDPVELFFTGSATEANHLALRSAAFADPSRRRVLISAIEHPSVYDQWGDLEGEDLHLQEIPVEASGVVDLEALAAMLGPDVAAVAVLTAHNETGVLQPVEEVGRLCARWGVLFHTDAVQALGKVPSPWRTAAPHYLTVAAHKLYGPKGIGALVARKGAPLIPMLRGGGQEGGVRSSTEAVPLAVGFGAASSLALDHLVETPGISALRDRLEAGCVSRHGAVVHGGFSPRLPNTSFASFPGLPGAALLSALDARGVAVAMGSACHGAGAGLPRVLARMGVESALAGCALRVSLGLGTTGADVESFLDALSEAVAEVRSGRHG